ncbi:site-2 protease family protein [cf. Phormidesmis sp. LEGE 11477]|uniref:site-2 protease family protein n=1 Tax=cf. Phormidesmis sp. LEGE 11477 TaxID=1828680 RepID=UPI00188238DD|nr:site-2 protease family protein [cf. Phormidesmis sp. LEGE 11477]MBE9060646.1 site-2 protease family protein [cf. Phormidesmis sp. LEGE 11477]
MPLVLLTLLIGLMTYWVINNRLSKAKTPVPLWLIWLVMMAPILVFTVWMNVGDGNPPPAILLYGLMAGSTLFLYTTLVVSSVQAKQRAMDTAQQSADGPKKELPPAKKEPTNPLSRDEETLLQRCFPWSTYYLQNIEYLPQAMICKGKLKTSPQEAYKTVQKNVESSFGDRFLVLLQEGLNGTPFFALVPNPQAKNAMQALPASATPAQIAQLKKYSQRQVTRPVLAAVLALVTLLTTTFVGSVLVGGIDDPAALQAEPELLLPGLAYSLSLMFILGVHESGHYLATRYHRLKATLPYFIPIPFFLGTLGAFIQMRSPIPNRRALFDVGISGPLAGLIVSLPILAWGLANSTVVPLSEASQLLSFDSLNPSRSIALLVMSKLALGQTLQADSAIDLHPLAISGCLGLIVTALNLMPVGQLDGGHIVHAMYGQRTAIIVSHVARVLMLVLAYAYQEFLFWALFLLFVPAAQPALNDVSELNGPRDFLGLVSLALLVIIILPAPASLQGLLL